MAATTSLEVKVHVPDAHSTKFDRQMRLWGAHGQKGIEGAHICCIGSGPTASETLKNLVLPNVGEFTIVDDAITGEADLGNNFFVDESYVGKPRAVAVTDLLREMNPDVKGNAIVEKAADFIGRAATSIGHKYTLVVGSCLSETLSRKLSEYCSTNGIKLMLIKSYGFFGYLRLVLGEHRIVESHPTNDRFDIFVHPDQIGAFPALQAFVDGFSFGPPSADKEAQRLHAHIPYAAVLAHEMKLFKAQHGFVPRNHAEQQLFKQQLRSSSWPSEDGLEPNYDEAVEFASRAYYRPTLDGLVQATIDDEKATTLTASSDPFWFIVRGIRDFMAGEGKGNIPCSPAIPDMQCESKVYITLKGIYQQKFVEDVAAITAHVKKHLAAVGKPVDYVTASQLEFMVRNVRSLRVIRSRNLDQEYAPETFLSDDINEAFDDIPFKEDDPKNPIPLEERVPNPPNVVWYFALRAAEAFNTKNGRYPGVVAAGKDSVDLKADVAELTTICEALHAQYGIRAPVDVSTLIEITRQGATEMHNTAAFMGGVGSQEALKLLVGQFVPINNTFIWNGGAGSSLTIQL